MKAYTMLDLVNRAMLGHETFYDAPEADARIEQLERALKSTSHVLSQMLKKDEALAGLAREALNAADQALTVAK